MQPHDPIPIPAAHQWREFRIRRLPAVFFSIALIAIVYIWNGHVVAPSMTGEVVVVSANVSSTVPGQLTELSVELFQPVTKNQVICKLAPIDADALKASLAAVEMDLKVLRARTALDQERNTLNRAALRLDYLDQRVALATAKVDLQTAEREYQRYVLLKEEKLASESEHDLVKNLRDMREADVREREKLVTELEKQIERLAVDTGNEADPFETAIRAQESMLVLTEGPITLRAPIDGNVSVIGYQQGENVIAGLPIVTISSPQASRIRAFMRQPIAKLPKAGDPIVVRTRNTPRRNATATILNVGLEMQPVGSLSMNGTTNAVDRGLPFLVSVPEGLALLPGEIVDLVLR